MIRNNFPNKGKTDTFQFKDHLFAIVSIGFCVADSAAIFAKDFSGLLLEKSAKTTRQPMPSAAPIRIWTPPVLQAIYYLRL